MSLNVKLSNATPAPGETVTMTVTSDKRLVAAPPFPVAAGGETVTVNFSVQTGVTIGAGAPATTKVSDNGSVAVYTFVVPTS